MKPPILAASPPDDFDYPPPIRSGNGSHEARRNFEVDCVIGRVGGEKDRWMCLLEQGVICRSSLLLDRRRRGGEVDGLGGGVTK